MHFSKVRIYSGFFILKKTVFTPNIPEFTENSQVTLSLLKIHKVPLSFTIIYPNALMANSINNLR